MPRRGEKGEILISSDSCHTVEFVRATSLLRSAPGGFLHFAKPEYRKSWLYKPKGLHIRSHLNNSSISNMFSKVSAATTAKRCDNPLDYIKAFCFCTNSKIQTTKVKF